MEVTLTSLGGYNLPAEAYVSLWLIVLFMGPIAGHPLVMIAANGITPPARHARIHGRKALDELGPDPRQHPPMVRPRRHSSTGTHGYPATRAMRPMRTDRRGRTAMGHRPHPVPILTT